jgi:amicyanin
MNAKLIGIVLVIAVALGVGIMAVRKPAQEHTSQGNQSNHENNAAQPPEQSSGQVEATAVEVKGFAYSPASIKIKKGTTVTWTNRDTSAHNVVVEEGAPAGGPKGPLFGKDQTYSFTFNQVGTFPYFCEPHPFMKGTVQVVE